MDPLTMPQVAFVISRLADGALGEAGKQAWDALIGLVRRARRRESPQITTLKALASHEGGQVDVRELATALVEQAESDPGFQAALREWWIGADRLIREGGQANVNMISGTVHGSAVQTRDVMGSINFGHAQPGDQRI
jgi:hypothetical protein